MRGLIFSFLVLFGAYVSASEYEEMKQFAANPNESFRQGVVQTLTERGMTIEQINSFLPDQKVHLFSWMFEQGLLDDFIPPSNVSLLHLAAFCQADSSVLEKLIAQGEDVNQLDDNGSSPLTAAVCGAYFNPNSQVAYLEIVRFFLQKGANPNAQLRETGLTPLSMVCLSKEVDQFESLITMLLEAGANPNLADKNQCTALHYAIIRKASPQIIRLLLTFKADPNMGCNFPTVIPGAKALHCAIQHTADPAVVEALLQAGADPSGLDSKGFTPMHHAIATAKYGQDHPNTTASAKLLMDYETEVRGVPLQDFTPFRKIAEELLGERHPITALLTR